MDRFAIVTLIALLCCSGCGPSSQTTSEQPVDRPESTAAKLPTSSATDVVSQFLDEIRRGGQDSQAHRLLTQRAQQELKRIGRTIQPIGSPDARFEVTRAEVVPEEENSVLVHSIWSEPKADGTKDDFQVVWAVEQESGEWRISGLVMQASQDALPMVIDFENGELMARLLANPDPSTGSGGQGTPAATREVKTGGQNPVAPNPGETPAQAAATNPNLSR